MKFSDTPTAIPLRRRRDPDVFSGALRRDNARLQLRCFATICFTAAAALGQVVGPTGDGNVIVPTGHSIQPAGKTVEFEGRPVDIALSPDGKTLYGKDHRGLFVVDTATWILMQELPFPNDTGGSMHGIAVSQDGNRVYATTAQNVFREAKVGPDRRLTLERSIALPGPEGEDSASHSTGIALSELRPMALVCLSRNNSLALVNLNDGRKEEEILVGVAPYDVVIDPHGLTVYVSNWGGRFPTAGDHTADSSGTPTVIDERGVAATGSISIVDLAARKEVHQIAVGLHPSDLALTKDGKFLYVACANSDEVYVIDTMIREVIESFSVRPNAALPFGSLPNALALGPREDRLYVANGGNNAVAVVDVAPERRQASVVRGFIPSGWFPAALAADSERLYVANAKGVGSRSKHADQRGWDVYWHRGSVSQVAYPAEAELARLTGKVLTNARLPQALRAWERSTETRKAVAVPAALGGPSVFEHVIYVVKENRTYDQVFGDLPQGNGDPELCIFPRELTPNHHALAEQFVLLDNYYCNGVNSADGHAWSMEGIVTDHLEKSFGGFTRSYTFGNDPISYASSGFIWDSVLSAGLSFRNFGEFNATRLPSASISFLDVYRDYTAETRSITFTHSIGVDRLRTFSSPDYSGWNLNIPDQLRADVFIRELHAAEADGVWPNMTIVYLPQDHTSGTKEGMPTPRAHVADNDLALGRIVEAVTKSRFWPKTCIFVIEDDPQDGFDHVDGHRSLCLVVSPYTKRGKVVSEFYNQTSVLHTIARILGIPPLNQIDSSAPLMSKCFRNKEDPTPYTALPANVRLDEMNPEKTALAADARYWAERSAAQPFERFDEADDDTLNRILWHAMKGYEAEYPAHLAGAHGMGLKKLGLITSGAGEDEEE